MTKIALYSADYTPFIFPIDWHYYGCIFICANSVKKSLLAEHCYSLLLNVTEAKPDSNIPVVRCKLCTEAGREPKIKM